MHDLIIIGAGPAGLTAGLYAGRFRLKTVILERLSAGGQIILSSDIENYPGFPGGIATFELIERFKKQVEDVGVAIEQEEVVALEKITGGLKIESKEKTFQARSLIVACGARPKLLGVKGEEQFIGRGVSYCGTCDGPLFKDKVVVLVGGGDRAIEEALFLTKYAKQVIVIHRRNELRASKILVDKAHANSKITFMLESVVEEIRGTRLVEEVLLKNVKTGAVSSILCQGVFIFVGIVPATKFAENFLDMDEKGFIITDQEMISSQMGVFACGDCRSKSLYQVVNACGEGAVACDAAHKYLLNL